MKRLGLFQIDAFAASPFGGNPAAVILDGEGLDEAKMRAIAREMNLPATAFLSSTSPSRSQLLTDSRWQSGSEDRR